MPLLSFDQTLSRFGLEKLKSGLDLQLTASGDLASTEDGDVQMGDSRSNGLFRFVERWRQTEPAIAHLFGPMAEATIRIEGLRMDRESGQSASLVEDPAAYHEINDRTIEAALTASTLAGSIAVLLHNLFDRLQRDLGASDSDVSSADPKFCGFSFALIFKAAAANFRHYDEWARAKSPDGQQRRSMEVLCALLGKQITDAYGLPAIRSNVCDSVLKIVSGGSIDALHQRTFDYAKSLAKYV
ncbi:hypothetical protein K6X13_17270 [Xanthomonas euvesicatoria pv. allii]|uniref:hypothetical protein n=1 Tax=Xanthomonas euvesicatoria TaxID=456327 RepID=UPI002407250F|nr:hypothetical protein [Xanthomonas euvesicatoria]MCP3048827.1 hypothetical protein [Xanthomonas euvesicatoria pv. allii]